MNISFKGGTLNDDNTLIAFEGTVAELRELVKSLGPTSKEQLDAECLSIARQGDKIAAIKLYRNKTGSTLLDAKNYVEALCARGAP